MTNYDPLRPSGNSKPTPQAMDAETLVTLVQTCLFWRRPKEAIQLAHDACDQNRIEMIRAVRAREKAKGTGSPAEHDRSRPETAGLEAVVDQALVRVPVCLKLSGEANYDAAMNGYNVKTGALTREAEIHLIAATHMLQVAYSEFNVLDNELKQSVTEQHESQFLTELFSMWFSAHHRLGSVAYANADRQEAVRVRARRAQQPARKPGGMRCEGQTEKPPVDSDYVIKSCDAAGHFDRAIRILYLAGKNGISIPGVTAREIRGLRNNYTRAMLNCSRGAKQLGRYDLIETYLFPYLRG